jgi:hypothetical protein
VGETFCWKIIATQFLLKNCWRWHFAYFIDVTEEGFSTMNVGWLQALGMQFLHMQYFSQPNSFCSKYPICTSFYPITGKSEREWMRQGA